MTVAAGPRLQDILLLVGQLNYTWTNTESLLIYLIAGLAKVEKETAIVIFLTLNTTRARIDLVDRLAKMQKTPVACRKDVLAITDQLLKQGKLRNKYSHCIYSFDETGSRASTQLMRIFDTKDSIKYGKVDPLDDAEMRNIAASIDKIRALNDAILAVVVRYGFPR